MKNWQKTTLLFAGIYNVLWGAFVIFFPKLSYIIFNLPMPYNSVIWQSMGMVIGCYGIGYWLASKNPTRHWIIVFVGLLGKLFGPIGFVYYAIQGLYPWNAGVVHIFNDVIWWIPFVGILKDSIKKPTEKIR